MNRKFFKSVEVKIAFFAVLGLFLLVWGINFLKGIDLFKKSYQMYVVFDNSLGLSTAGNVMVNGVVIGSIDKIDLLPSAENKVIIRVEVEKKIAIPRNSAFTIGSTGLLGSSCINVAFSGETQYYQKGDTVYGVITPGLMSAMSSLTANLENIVTALDTSINILKQTLQSDTKTDFDIAVHNLRESTESLSGILAAVNKNKISAIVSDVNVFTTTLKNNDAKLNDIVENLNNVSKQLADSDIKKTIDDAAQTFAHLDSILLAASEGKGSVGQLLVNDSLYYNLQNSLHSLDALLIDLQKNPKKYINVTVFGKKEKK
jgi:phospholipid/cholesterol/gamma-HCH transport system substrate-binding protein